MPTGVYTRPKSTNICVKCGKVIPKRHKYCQDYFSHLLTLWDRGWYTEEYNCDYKRMKANWR